MKFRKKPVVIEATQWFKLGDHPAVEPFKGEMPYHPAGEYGWVPTLEGGHVVTPGDWIITGVKGEHYPCKPDIFAQTYESASSTGEAPMQAEPVAWMTSGTDTPSFRTAAQKAKADPIYAALFDVPLYAASPSAHPVEPGAPDSLDTREFYEVCQQYVCGVIEFEAVKQWVRANALADLVQRLAASTSAPAPQPEPNELEAMRARKDAAYEERNKVVAALAKLFPSGVAKTAIEGWSEDWHGCVYIDLPTGQVSWHFHDSQAHLFAGLPPYTKPWDGHDTPEKYRRLAALAAPQEVQPSPAAQPEVHFVDGDGNQYDEQARLIPAAAQGLTDAQIEDCKDAADRTYREHKHSIRGQQLTAADSWDWHFAKAVERALSAGAAVPQSADTDTLNAAYLLGWGRAAQWANRLDLMADTTSPAYIAERDEGIAALSAAPAPAGAQKK